MTNMTSYAPAFASPTGGDTTGAVRTLAAGRLQSTRKRIVTALAESGRREETAQAAQAFVAGKGSAWRPETGLALLAHRRGQHGLAALQFAAACAGMGGSGRVDTRLETAHWLYMDGWLTPVHGETSLSADGVSIAIHSDYGRTTYQASEQGRWSPAEVQGPWTALPSGGLAPRYVTVSGLRHSVEGFPWIADAPPQIANNGTASARLDVENASRRITSIQQGWNVIINHTPIYGAWVASTSAGCLLIEPSGSPLAQSGSSYDHPGLIAIEPPESPVFCGEILVHECSHQQLLIYGMVAPLVTPGSQEQYYSPIKRATRPIDRVLTGAHAVGNMIIYYATLRQSMDLDSLSADRFHQHRKWFAEDYRPALDRSQSLTEAGRTLWASLCSAVDSATEQ